MPLVTLVSGGLDSSVMAVLAQRQTREQFPLFLDYGQLCCEREWRACRRVHQQLGLRIPARMNLSGFGKMVSSGLTSRKKRLNEDAFLPGRNLLFLVAGAGYACEKGADTVCIGLLSEANRLFPDQTIAFLKGAEAILQTVTMRKLKFVAPLMRFTKAEIVALARKLGVSGTYSCHAGTAKPCGVCLSCMETIGLK